MGNRVTIIVALSCFEKYVAGFFLPGQKGIRNLLLVAPAFFGQIKAPLPGQHCFSRPFLSGKKSEFPEGIDLDFLHIFFMNAMYYISNYQGFGRI